MTSNLPPTQRADWRARGVGEEERIGLSQIARLRVLLLVIQAWLLSPALLVTWTGGGRPGLVTDSLATTTSSSSSSSTHHATSWTDSHNGGINGFFNSLVMRWEKLRLTRDLCCVMLPSVDVENIRIRRNRKYWVSWKLFIIMFYDYEDKLGLFLMLGVTTLLGVNLGSILRPAAFVLSGSLNMRLVLGSASCSLFRNNKTINLINRNERNKARVAVVFDTSSPGQQCGDFLLWCE